MYSTRKQTFIEGGNNKGLAHMYRLISTLVVHCLINKHATFKFSRFKVQVKVGLRSFDIWSEYNILFVMDDNKFPQVTKSSL